MKLVYLSIVASCLFFGNLKGDEIVDDLPVQPLGLRDFLIDVAEGSYVGGAEASEKIRFMALEMGLKVGMNNAYDIRVRKIAVGGGYAHQDQLMRYGMKLLTFVFFGNLPLMTIPCETAIARHALLFDLPLFPKYLFIDETFFDQLTPQAQRFLIAHNLMRLKYRHIIIKFIVGWGAWLIIDDAVRRRVAPIYMGNGPLELAAAWALRSFITGCIAVPTMAFTNSLFSKLCTLHADHEAHRELDLYEGGIEYLAALENQEQQHEAEMPQWTFLVWERMLSRFLYKTYGFFCGSYPAHSTRTEMLHWNKKKETSEG